MNKIRLILIVCMLMLPSCHSNRKIDIHDGFEAASISRIWETNKLVPGTFEIQSSTQKAGNNAFKITLHEGDQIKKEIGTILERSELTESRKLWARDDESYIYCFSVFIPQDFPIVPTRLVIAQWKQKCPGEDCRPDNPLIAVRYVAGELYVTHQISSEQKILYRTTQDIRNKWLDFMFLICFSRQQSGQIRAWLNNEEIIDYEGLNAYPESGGYPGRNRFYFKMGLYRDRMVEPMTIYFDEYAKFRPPSINPLVH